MNKDELMRTVMSVPLFSVCDPAKLRVTKKIFAKGQTVADTSDGVPCVGIVAAGEIAVSPDADNDAVVSILRAGDLFGICNILARDEMPTHLVCEKKATVAFMTKDDFVTLMRENPEFSLRYAQMCNEKIMFLARKVAFAGLTTAEKKVRTFLAQNAKHSQDGKTLVIPSKEKLCRQIGISHAALFRELSKLKQQGMIEIKENTIVWNGGGEV